MEVVTEVKRMFDLVSDVGGAVITHKAVETVIDYIFAPLLFLLNLLLSSSFASHHFRLHLYRLLVLMPLL